MDDYQKTKKTLEQNEPEVSEDERIMVAKAIQNELETKKEEIKLRIIKI